MIGIVDYGSGNVHAISNIYSRLNIPVRVVSTAAELDGVAKIVLPGVGAFDQAVAELDRSGIRAALDDAVLHRGTPVLGICVGMQLFARGSEEGQSAGLGWIDGVVRRFNHSVFHQATHLPHMGWNSVRPVAESPLFEAIEQPAEYYFLHSYYFACSDPADILALTTYGEQFSCAVQHLNVFGVQFHPEKSHQSGIQLLKNFALMR